jgi:hypothetical protein
MQPFFGPDREETLQLLRRDDAAERLPITLGDGMPSYVIDTLDGRWVLIPLLLDDDAAREVQEAAAVDSGLWSWDFLQRAEPIYATPSKAEFIRWLEMWSWLGTGVPRAARAGAHEVTAVELEFENLMDGTRNVFSWTRSPDSPALETLHVLVEQKSRSASESVEVPAHLWAEFVDVLRTHCGEAKPPPAPVAESDVTRPNLIVSQRLLREIGGGQPDAAGRTVDGINIDPSRYVICSMKLAVTNGRRAQCKLKREEASELLDFVVGFATEFGLNLPVI